MLLVAHHLIDGFSNVNATPLQFNLNEGKTIDKDCHIVAIDILPDNGYLVCHLKDILCVICIEEGEIYFCPVLTLQHKFISENFCTLKN